MADKLKIPPPSFLAYSYGRLIPLKRAKLIFRFLDKTGDDLIGTMFEENFRQKLGGMKSVSLRKKRGTFDEGMKNMQEIQSKRLMQWHKEMKEKKPQEYYQIQYNRFKKIGGYKFITKNGERVRNFFEQKVANLLFDHGVEYKYEPLIHVGKRYFFPDFLVNGNLIIECTAWKGEAKAYKLKEKIFCLKEKYKVYVVIPSPLRKYYKVIESSLLVGLDEVVQMLNLQINKV